MAGKAWGIRQQQTSFRSNFVAIGGVQLLAQLLSGGLAEGSSPPDVSTVRQCLLAGLSIARNIISPHADEFGCFGNRERSAQWAPFNEDVPENVAAITREDIRELDRLSQDGEGKSSPGSVEFWLQLSYRVAWSAAAGRTDLLSQPLSAESESETANQWDAGVDEETLLKGDTELSCDALLLLQQCVRLRWDLAQETSGGSGAGKGKGKGLRRPGYGARQQHCCARPCVGKSARFSSARCWRRFRRRRATARTRAFSSSTCCCRC